jgi:hypothetical protein
LFPIIYHQIFNKFEYGGVKFEKEMIGKTTFYHGQFPIVYKGNLSALYNVYLRTDPRKNDIPINTNFTLSQKVYVSLSEEATYCNTTTLGQSEFGKFIPTFPWVKSLEPAMLDAQSANLSGRKQITCANATKDKTVIVVQKSDFPSIESGEKANCYVLNIGNCEYLKTVERYVVGSMAQINGVKI